MDQLWLWPAITTVAFASAVAAVILVRRWRFKTLLPQAAILVPPSDSVVWFLDEPPLDPGSALVAAAPLSTIAGVLHPDVTDTLEPWQDREEASVAALEGFAGNDIAYHNALTIDYGVVRGPQAIDVGKSLKNGALDAAGPDGGSFAGLSLGQVLGRALLDRTGKTAAAALLSIGGAILSRLTSDRVKRKNFRTAVETLDAERTSAVERIENLRRANEVAIRRFVEDRNSVLRDATIEERRKTLAAVRDGRNCIANERHLACEAFVSHLGEVRQRIWEGLYVFRETHQSSIFTRWLYPSQGDVAVELAKRWAQDASSRVEQLHTFLWTLLSSPDEAKRIEATRVISEFIRTFDCDAAGYYLRIKSHADRVSALQQLVQEQVETLDARLIRLVVEAQQEVNAFIDASDVRLREHYREIIEPVSEALERVRSERRKLGL